MARPTGNPTRAIPLRLTQDQTDRVKHASERLGISQQDIMRMAMGIGIEALKNVDWDLEKLVADAAFPGDANGKTIKLNPGDLPLAAEGDKDYGKGKKKGSYGSGGDE